ncbi:MAG: Asp-tRNA(Asn)/Glu-tRNA(Gln) amidotransferase subunit GatB, partial [Chloroflexi bacterium]|nr:Asp-tRNA(Asn)/Glu-tRNA(Gln) amidotransferase subunit GatB [Chloroflexota bacterium]
NYPYPDLPKGYQISQYDFPLCVQGHLSIETGDGRETVRIRRVHLEEDTAKLTHAGACSLIDYNRAGVPLMEIVTEADLHSAEAASEYLTRLRAILRSLGVNSGNMEEGALRCEANVSLRPVGSSVLGTKVEVKNLNSFRAVRQAIAYEIERQGRLLDAGEHVEQVTMGWDEVRGCTVFQRSKEGAEDYRYFPEPDLPPLTPERAWVEQLWAALPELPADKAARYEQQYGLRTPEARQLAEERAVAEYYDAAVKAAAGRVPPRTVANWVLSELFRLLREHAIEITACQVQPPQLTDLIALVHGGTITATVGKQVLEEMFASGKAAEAIVQRLGLTQVSDSAELAQVVARVVANNPKPVQQYLEGKETVLGFLVGQVMRETRGQANPSLVGPLLKEQLEKQRDR